MKSEVKDSVAIVDVIVTDDMTAQLDGKLIHRVFSTYWLCYYAEVAARRAIEPFFDDGENAIGGSVEIKHHAMAPVGANVTVMASVTEVKGKKIVCSIEAKHSGRLIATGSQTQIVLPDTDVQSMVEKVYQQFGNLSNN